MRGRKIPVSTLIPASEWLYDYYGKMGYATVFDYTPEHYTILDKPVADHFRVEAIREVGLLTDDLFNYFQSMMRLRPCCVLHEREDFEVIVESLRMDGGALIVVYSDKNIVGIAFAEPRGNHALVLDGMYDSEDVKRVALWGSDEISGCGRRYIAVYFLPERRMSTGEWHVCWTWNKCSVCMP